MLEVRMNAEGINLTALVGLVLEARKKGTTQCMEFIAQVEDNFAVMRWDHEDFDWDAYPEEWAVYQDYVNAYATKYWIPQGIRFACATKLGLDMTQTFHKAFDKAMESAEPAYWAWIEQQGW